MANCAEKSGFVEFDGVRLHYRWAGLENGPVLMLSHSLGTASDLWATQEATLGERYRLLLYDHRGHGESSTPPGPWTIADFGRDALGLLDQLVTGPVFFCGLSLGGMVGLWLAQHAPGRLRSLIVANTSAFTADPTLLRERLRTLENEGLGSIADNVLARWFTDRFCTEQPDVVAHFRSRLLATSLAGYRATAEAVCGLDLREGLSEIYTPVLVIMGQHDRAAPPAWGLAIAAAIPGAAQKSLDAAHLSNVEAAAAFDASTISFLEG